MPKFLVTVVKTEVYSTDIEVTAKTLAEAERIAEDKAQDEPQSWSYGESEFSSFGDEI